MAVKTTIRYYLNPKDGEDGKAPYIGDDGYWYEWDESQGKYVKTTHKALGQDGSYPVFRYQKNSSPTTPPYLNPNVNWPPGWSLNRPEVNEGEYLWFTMAMYRGETKLTDWSYPPALWGSAKGKDGKDHEFIFTRNNTGIAPNAPATSQEDDHVPDGWSGDPQGVTALLRYEYVSLRAKVNGVWSSFSTPSVWAKWSSDGVDGIDIHVSKVNIPVQCNSAGIPVSFANTGLSIKLSRGSYTLEYTGHGATDVKPEGGDYSISASVDGVSGFTLPVNCYLSTVSIGNISGLSKDVGTVTLTFTIYDYKNHSTYEVQRVISYVKNKDGKDGTDGTDGIDGTDGASQLVAYKRSLSKPATPSPSTSTPPGWYDTPDYAVDNLNVTGISVENCAGSIAAAQPGEREPYLWKKQDDGFHKSPPISHNDHVRCRLIFETTLANTTVKVQLKVSSEQGYDKLHVGRLDTALNVNYADSLALRTISGSREETLSVAVSSAGIHFLDFIYKKDGSGSVGLDAGQFKLEGAVERIWMTRCAVVGGVCQGWSIPVMYQDKPADTIIPYPDGVWSEFSEYERTERHAPYVEHEGEYYLLVKPGLIGEGSNPNPWEDYAVNRGTGTWDRMDKFDMVFTKILLAEFAKLGSAVFTTNRMISQQGKKNGIASYAYQEYAGDGGAWQPNILLDFLTGGGHFAARNIRWTPDGWLYARRIIPDVQISSNVLSIGEYLEDPNTPEILILCRPSGGTLPAYIDELPTPSANYIGKNLILYNNTIGWHGQAEVEGSMFYKNPSSLSFDSNGNMQNHNTYSGHLTKIKLKPGVGVYMTCVPYVAGGSYSTYTGYTWWIREIFYCPCYENQ